MPRKYLHSLTGKSVPRQTLHSRRKKWRELQQLLAQQEDAVSSTIAAGYFEGNENDNVEDTSYAPLSSSSDSDDFPVQSGMSRENKKRRRKRKREDVERAAPFSPSSDSEPQPDNQVINIEEYVNKSSQNNIQSVEEEEVCIVEEESADTPLDFSFQNNADPLCPCTNVTVGDLVVMTLALGLRHGLTWVAQCDILKMFSTVFKGADIPCSKHLYLDKINVKYSQIINHHVFCNKCNSYLGQRQKGKKKKGEPVQKVLKCPVCVDKKVNVMKPDNCFVSLSIESQLKSFMLDNKFVDNLVNHRFKARSEDSNVITDIFDSNMYRKLSDNDGILSCPYNFSYQFFTDGVPFGKSSSKTIWPIYLTINELPLEERKKYLILAAVYAGSNDPNQSYFLKPFVTEANKLSSKGFSWIHNGKEVNSLVIPFCCVADSVARFQLLNFQTFHAAYGCTFCYKMSKHTGVGSRYTVGEGPAPYRTAQSYKEDLFNVFERRHETQEKNRVCRGVKGPCSLIELKYFDITSNFVVDYMHCLLLGVAKTHTDLILDPWRKKMWTAMNDSMGIAHLKAVIDDRIKQLQSNSSIFRELRPITDMKLWRANEHKAWIVFYCIPCLSGLLKDKYLIHLGMLSKATALLLKKSLHREEINEAHRLLMTYTFFFEKYFGEESMLYNVHLLSHVTKGILNFGPVSSTNSFLYEAENRYLLELCKSPFSVALQIAKKFLTFQALPVISKKLASSNSTVQFVEQLLNYKRLLRCERSSDNACVLLGKPKQCSLQDCERVLVSDFVSPSNCCECRFYNGIIYKKTRYSTASYCSELANNDSHAFLKTGECVLIHKIFILPSRKVGFLVQSLHLDSAPCLRNDFVSVNHLQKVVSFGNMMCVTVDKIAEPCMMLALAGIQYAARIPYGCTIE